jgi:hypothetical protein
MARSLRAACLLAAVVVLAASWPCLGAAQPTPVETPQQFRQALEDPDVSSINIMKALTLGRDWGPVRVNRPLLVQSPHRAILDFCDDACNAGSMPHPHIIIGAGGSVSFTRLFFRNFIPLNVNGSYVGWDFTSPAPSVVSEGGGQSTYNLVVWHWSKGMTWAFQQPGSFWNAAAASKLRSVGDWQPLQFDEPKLYNLKNFAMNPSAQIVDCYIPMDVQGCFWDQPSTTLVYW